MISTGVRFDFSSACALGVATGDATWVKPVLATLPVRWRSPWPGPATPLPNPALAIVPRAPCAPPVPLPVPGPAGKSKEPNLAATSWPFFSDVPFTPFGSPKPPVCTSRAGFCSVAGAELPDAKFSVTTSFFGRTGFTTSVLLANVSTTISFLGFGATGSGTLVNSSGCSFGSGFGRSGGSTTFGGVNFASTLGGGGTIFCTGGCTGGVSTGGVYSNVTCDWRSSTCGDGNHL